MIRSTHKIIPGEHHDDDTALLPDHLPEVCHCVRHGPLAHDVGRVARVVVRLENSACNVNSLWFTWFSHALSKFTKKNATLVVALVK